MFYVLPSPMVANALCASKSHPISSKDQTKSLKMGVSNVIRHPSKLFEHRGHFRALDSSVSN